MVRSPDGGHMLRARNVDGTRNRVAVRIPDLVAPLFQLVAGIIVKNPDMDTDELVAEIDRAIDFPELIDTFDHHVIRALVELAMSLGQPQPDGGFGTPDVGGLLNAVVQLAMALVNKDAQIDLGAVARVLDDALPLPFPFEVVDGWLIRGALELGFFVARRRQAAAAG